MFHPVLNNDLIVSEEACYDGIDDHVAIDFFLNKALASPCLRVRGGGNIRVRELFWGRIFRAWSEIAV